eukprot:PhM_4_TR8348/c0_g1_i2/m.17934
MNRSFLPKVSFLTVAAVAALYYYRTYIYRRPARSLLRGYSCYLFKQHDGHDDGVVRHSSGVFSKLLHNETAVSIDTEFTDDGVIRVIQISGFRSKISVVLMVPSLENEARTLPKELVDILECPDIVKVGFGVQEDCYKIEDQFENVTTVHPVYDLGRWGRKHFGKTGLASVSERVLRIKDVTEIKHRAVTMSNWGNSVLTQEQIDYAHFDVIAGSEVLEQILLTDGDAVTQSIAQAEKTRENITKKMKKKRATTPTATLLSFDDLEPDERSRRAKAAACTLLRSWCVHHPQGPDAFKKSLETEIVRIVHFTVYFSEPMVQVRQVTGHRRGVMRCSNDPSQAQWFVRRNGWQPYEVSEQHVLESAYQSGEKHVDLAVNVLPRRFLDDVLDMRRVNQTKLPQGKEEQLRMIVVKFLTMEEGKEPLTPLMVLKVACGIPPHKE